MTKPLPSLLPPPVRLVIHQNGPHRKRKVMMQTEDGIFSARRYYYALYHPDWDRKGKIIHLDQDDLNFDKDNLVLLTQREANTLVHFNNNNIVHNNPELQSQVIQSIRASIALDELRKEVNTDE